ncbi:T9SS type A sorting domain-containing protein [Flavobacterium sp. MFBS3-15]|uniref:T9SS-dependent choice-of-anchor J family protein n=1 Tax=Flavobacterium sp. MFBS3-15 TaxID=2989816 RepID=UPI002235F6F5|nr:T9SS type A sorting domain-containing protein [Flavobacterium sp. MFBS3-15]MCW4470175.1 T9SS type A sorting domain-containing protein [Flavobacterium sp. MFBS3-15]
MKRLLLLGIALSGSVFEGSAQTVLIEDGFENYEDFIITGIGDWLTLDLDGSATYTGGTDIPWENANDPQAFIVFNPSAAGVTNATSGNEVRNFDPHGGEKYAGSWAAVMPGDGEGGAGPNNDWLVSPPLNLGASSNELTFWVKSLSNSYGLENYQVGIYTGTGAPSASSDFTLLPGAGSLTAPYPTWELKTFSLDAYANQTIRVGIHCTSVNAYFFMVDDFKVTTATVAGVNDNLASQFSVYPNPSSGVVTISNKNNILIEGISISDINGRTVKQINAGNVTETQVTITDLAAGVYLMTLSSDKGSMTKKIIKN